MGRQHTSRGAERRELVEAARRLRRDGNPEDAHRLLREAADSGLIDAMIELARLARDDGRRDESDKWMASAEKALQPDDLEGRIALSGAYGLALGRGTLFEQQERALELLIEVGEAGGYPRVQEDLALQFLHGLNGCRQDEKQFEYWISRAVETGSPRAAYIHAEHLRKRGRPIPGQLVTALAAVADENKSAKKLLAAIARRPKNTRK
jgi:TPR repeat protein